jgi:hypothetical protein
MKEILLTITFEPKQFIEFIDYCRDILHDNEGKLEDIDEFKRNYRNKTSIWWYTSPCFLYSMLNCAVRLSDVDIIIRMGFFIGDLHRQIEQLNKGQSVVDHMAAKMLSVYRGQGLSKADFQKMKETNQQHHSLRLMVSVIFQRKMKSYFQCTVFFASMILNRWVKIHVSSR